MSLSPGGRLGPYEILSLLGAGGMGEVYRARDPRLGRDVAIKVLPTGSLVDADQLLRFEQEARSVGALNHPNILAVFDTGVHDETPYVVSELLEGETLSSRLGGAPLPARKVVDYAVQIAHGLGAAHEKGIVHRDLKPDNLFVTRDGRVKILDFGLAKRVRAPMSGDAPTGSVSVAGPATEPGTVLGTIGYMSPEQVRGLPADARSDIFSFGSVVYEMLSGRRAFLGETAVETMTAILKEDPPELSAARPDVPPVLARIVSRCLEKQPAERFQSIRDIGFALDAVSATSGAAALSPVQRRQPLGFAGTLMQGSVWMLGGTLLASAVFGGLSWRARRAPARNVQLQRITDFVGMEESPAISPDGKTVAFVAQAGGKRQIWVRLLAGGVPLQITRDDADHEEPRWAPDSSSLIYYSPSATPGEQGTLWEMSALGGPPRRVASSIGSGDVSHDGRRIAFFQLREGRTELAAVAREGTGTEPIVPLPRHLYSHPRWSPDDAWVAFQRASSIDFDDRLYVIPAAGGEAREVTRGDTLKGLSWLSDGSGLVYSSSWGSTVLYPPTFNLRVIGRDGTGAQQLTFGDVSYVEPDIHKSGKLLASRIRSQSDIWKFPIGGSPAENTRGGIRVTHQTGVAQTPSVSPDGSELVYLSDSGGHGNLWVAKTDGAGVRQITFERDPAFTIGVPVWSPARGWIAFITTQMGKTGLSLIQSDGSGSRQLVRGTWANWSGDGKWLYYSPGREGPLCIEKVPVEGGTPISVRCDNAGASAVAADGSTLYFATPLKQEATSWGDWEIRKARPEDGPSQPLARVPGSRVPVASTFMHMFLSPDGKWLALPLTDGGTSNLWAQPTDGGPMRQLTDFGEKPVVIARRVSWSPDGKYIYAAVAETDADIVLLDGLVQ